MKLKKNPKILKVDRAAPQKSRPRPPPLSRKVLNFFEKFLKLIKKKIDEIRNFLKFFKVGQKNPNPVAQKLSERARVEKPRDESCAKRGRALKFGKLRKGGGQK
jgi:hypothetical protein